MRFTKVADYVLNSAHALREAEQLRVGHGEVPEHPVLPPRRHKYLLRKLLSRQPAAVVFMLLGVMEIGRADVARGMNLLDFYCQASDAAWTPKRAIERILGSKQLFECLWRGLDKVKAKGINLDRVMPP